MLPTSKAKSDMRMLKHGEVSSEVGARPAPEVITLSDSEDNDEISPRGSQGANSSGRTELGQSQSPLTVTTEQMEKELRQEVNVLVKEFTDSLASESESASKRDQSLITEMAKIRTQFSGWQQVALAKFESMDSAQKELLDRISDIPKIMTSTKTDASVEVRETPKRRCGQGQATGVDLAETPKKRKRGGVPARKLPNRKCKNRPTTAVKPVEKPKKRGPGRPKKESAKSTQPRPVPLTRASSRPTYTDDSDDDSDHSSNSDWPMYKVLVALPPPPKRKRAKGKSARSGR